MELSEPGGFRDQRLCEVGSASFCFSVDGASVKFEHIRVPS